MRKPWFVALLIAPALAGAGCFRELDPEAFDVVFEADAATPETRDGIDAADAPDAGDAVEESDSAATDADVTPAE